MEDHVEVSVVIPCLNEANSIGICIDKALVAFKEANVRGEVVVADNGSTDGSVDIASAHGARVVSVEMKGYGHALRGGIEAACGEFIIMGDADDSYDFSEIPRFISKLHEGYEVVIGNRFTGEIKPGAMPWHHKYIGTPVLSTLLRLFFGAPVRDCNSGMRGFTKTIYRRMDLRTTGMEFASEFIIKAAKLASNMTEIPITLWPDKRGRPPHLRSFRDGWRHLRFMLMYAPNWLFLVPGFALVLAGLLLVFWLFPSPRWLGNVRLDYHTMFFGMIFTLIGTQIVTTGLFAKIFCYSEQFDRHQLSLERWLKRVTLEYGLLVGTGLILAGLAGNLAVFWQWAVGDFGEFQGMRQVIFWSLWLFLGIQIVFSSFFLSMLGISRDAFIGETRFMR